MTDKLKIAFLGGAYESAVGQVHRIAVEMDRKFELVAGCFSRNQETNKNSAIRYGVQPERTYSNLDELLKKENDSLDGIVILTPTDQHKSQVIHCLEADIPVICEKALAMNSVEAAEIKDVLVAQAGFLAVTYNYSGYPVLRELKHLVKNGKFGAIQQIHIEMPQEGFYRVNSEGKPVVPQAWRLHDGIIPTISLDLGVHLHMIVHFLTNLKPMKVVATSASYGNFPQVTDNVSCIAKYQNNMQCNIWYSKTALGQRNGLKLRVFGEHGSAEWVQENPEYLHLADNKGIKTVFDRASSEAQISNQPRYTRFKAGHPAGFIEAFANYYADVADALTEYRKNKKKFSLNQYAFGIDVSLEGLKLLEAIAESTATQSWIDIK